MFSKQKKWFSWLLVVTMLITIFPVHNLVFAAPGDNPSLDAALDAVPNAQTTTLVNIKDKNIKGVVNLEDIRTRFPRARAVNLDNNFITDITGNPNPGFGTVKSEGNLATTAQREITWDGSIERLSYNPEEIDIAAAYSQMMVAGKPGLSLQDLIDNGVIEGIDVQLGTNPIVSYQPATFANAKVDAAQVGALAPGSHNLILTVKYLGVLNAPETFTKTVVVKDLKGLKVEKLANGDTVQPGADVEVLVSKIGVNDEIVPFDGTTLNDVQVNPDPSMGYGAVNPPVLEAGGKVKLTFKFTNEFDNKPLEFRLVGTGISETLTISAKAIRLESITLIDQQSSTSNEVGSVKVETSGLAEDTKNIYVTKGTNVSSFDQNVAREREASITEGKYYIKVKQNGQQEEYLTDLDWLKVDEASSLVSGKLDQDEDGKVYLSVSADFEAGGGTADQLTIAPKASGLPGAAPSPLKIKLFPVMSQKAPSAYYIYEIEDVNASLGDIQDFANEEPKLAEGQKYGETETTKTKFYKVPLNETQQDGKTEFTVKEGKKKLYYPVAAYDVIKNGKKVEVRKVVPVGIKKTWYQKEKTLLNTFTAVPSDFIANGNYPGAPLTGERNPISGLVVTGKSKTNPSLGDIGNVSLALHHLNNNGLWFEVKWEERKIINYVLVEPNHGLNLSALNTEVQADKDQLIEAIKKATGDLTYNSFENTPVVKLPIGTDKQFKVLAVYDNGTVAEVGSTNALNPVIPNIVEANGNPKADDDIKVEGTDSVMLKLIATKNGGVMIPSTGKPTDAKVGNYGMLKVDLKTETGVVEKEIAKVSLAKSIVQNVENVSYDNLRLTANDDFTAGKIVGEWKDGTSVQIFQGDASDNEKLQTQIYFVPVYSNVDLNVVDLAKLQAGEELIEGQDNIDVVEKYGFDSVYWSRTFANAPGAPEGLTVDKIPQKAGIRLTTHGEPVNMANVGGSTTIEWTITGAVAPVPPVPPNTPGTPAIVPDYNGHKVAIPHDYKLTTLVEIQEPIYDKIGAFAEKDSKKDVDFDEATGELTMALGETKQIRTKLSNTNLVSVNPMRDGLIDKMKKGVYFFGSDIENAGNLDTPISSYGPVVPKPGTAATDYADLYMLYLASGQNQAVTPLNFADRVITDTYAGADADRAAALQAEQAKIVPKVYREKNGVYELVDPATANLKIEANATTPGVYDITAQGKGKYRIAFYAKHEGVESPLLKFEDNGQDQAYDTGAKMYYITVNIDQAPIKDMYYYIVDTPDGGSITLSSDNRAEKVHINPLPTTQSYKTIRVYPIVSDSTFESRFPVGTPVPKNLTELKAYAVAQGRTLEELLKDSESGLSFIKEADFDLVELRNRWMEIDPENAVVHQAGVDEKGFFVELFVQKAQLEDGRTNVGLDLVAGDFDKDPANPAAPAPLLLKATGKFLPAATPLMIDKIGITQELEDWIHDINPTPLLPNGETKISKGESMPFGVTYIMARGNQRDLTTDEIQGIVPTGLVITPAPANPGPVEIEKVAATNNVPAIVKFTPSKIGHYKFYLSTTNEKGQPVPAIEFTRTVEFDVSPYIKDEYHLYYGQSLPIDVDAGDETPNLTFSANTPGVLDVNALNTKKLVLDSNWEGVQVPNNTQDPTDVYVEVLLGGVKIGEFVVHAHPRNLNTNMSHQLLPVSSNADPYLVNNGDEVTLRIRRFFTDGTFDFVDVESVEFLGGNDVDFEDSLNSEEESFVSIDDDNPAKLQIRRVANTLDDTKDWYAEYKVTAVDGWIGTFYIQKNNAPVQRSVPTYKFYRLEPNGEVTKVTDPINIFEQQTRPETLFVIDESDANDLKLVSDYILGINPDDIVMYQRYGDTTTSSSITLAQLKNSPGTHSRLQFNPLRQGNVRFVASDMRRMTETVADYIIRQGQPLNVRIVGSTNRTLTEGEALNILAEVTGGTNPVLQWQESMDGVNWTPVAGQNTERLTIPNADMSMNGKMYRLEARDNIQTETSASVAVVVNPRPGGPQIISASIVPAEHRKQVGQSATFTLQLTGVPAGANVAYQWRVRTSTGWVTPGVTTDTFTIPSVTAEMHNNQYTCIVTVNGIPVDGINRGVLIVVDANGNPIQNTHRVTFSAGAHGSLQGHGASYSLTVVEGQSILATDVPVVLPHSGYQFTGWVPANPAGTVVTGPMTFVAQYGSTPSGGGGPGGGGGPAPTPQPQPIPQPQPQPTPQPQPERPKTPVLQLNKNFKGAYIAGYPDGTVRPSAQITRAEVSAIFARIMLEQMVDGKAYPSQFKDVAGGKWYSDYIGFLQDFSVLSGYPDGSFKPNNKITRAEFAVIVSKFFELKTTNNKFADVKENHWAKKYIDAAVANALMGGYPDGTFKPDQPITRAEVVTVINKALERTPNKADIDANPANAKRFKDLKPAHWAYYDMIEASTDHTK